MSGLEGHWAWAISHDSGRINTAAAPGDDRRMQSLETFNSKLYATAGTTAGDGGDIFICSPATAGEMRTDATRFRLGNILSAARSFESLYAFGGRSTRSETAGRRRPVPYPAAGSQPIATMPRIWSVAWNQGDMAS